MAVVKGGKKKAKATKRSAAKAKVTKGKALKTKVSKSTAKKAKAAPRRKKLPSIELVNIDCKKLRSREVLFREFAKSFGFPALYASGAYGEDFDAWLDCMTCLDEPVNGIQVATGGVVVLHLANASALRKRDGALYLELLENAALVNSIRLKTGELPVLMLSLLD